MDFIACLLFYCVEIKDKPRTPPSLSPCLVVTIISFSEQHGVCRAISYIVQALSADPVFGEKLRNPIRVQLPTKWGHCDTAADFIIQAVYSMVATTSGNLTFLYPALIIALSNLAPYFKHIGVSASARLLQLFTSFANPLFLLSDEGHPRLLFFMFVHLLQFLFNHPDDVHFRLEIFNSILHYNLGENANITYGILQSRKAFEDLGTFTLARGLRDVKRAQLEKEERAKKAANAQSHDKGKARVHDIEMGDPGAEKARLLESEGANDLERDTVTTPRESQGDEARPGLTSAASDISTHSSQQSPLSEKARGKMRERHSASIESAAALALDPASLNIGRNGFVPTQEWVGGDILFNLPDFNCILKIGYVLATRVSYCEICTSATVTKRNLGYRLIPSCSSSPKWCRKSKTCSGMVQRLVPR